MLTLRSVLVWLFTWVYMAVAGAIFLPWVWLTGRLGATYAVARAGLRLLLLLAGVRVVVEGRENLPASGGVIFMANHQSNLDPPILLAYLPRALSFLAKRELFSVPVLGTVARIGGLIPVDRGNRTAAHASIAEAAAAIRLGRPFLIFPEGTRSAGPDLLPFKKGPFYLAEQAGVAVVPISLAGTGALMPRGAWRIRAGVARLRIHPAIAPEAWSAAPEPRAALAEIVRARLAD